MILNFFFFHERTFLGSPFHSSKPKERLLYRIPICLTQNKGGMCMYPTQNTFFKFIFSPVSSFPLGTQQMSLLCTQKGVKVFSREELRKKAAGRSCAEIPSISLKQTKLKQTKGKLSKESVEVTGMLGEALNFMPAKKKKVAWVLSALYLLLRSTTWPLTMEKAAMGSEYMLSLRRNSHNNA